MSKQFLDANAALGFVLSQTSHIETEVNKTVYPDVQYMNLIPVDTSAHPFAKSVTYFSSDQFGKAEWVNGNSGDIPIAGTDRSKHETSVHMAGIGYGFGLEEINQAQQQGINLKSDDADAAREAYEHMVDDTMLRGDESKGFQGLLDYSGVTIQAAPTGAWVSATEDQMLADVNSAILGVATDTKQTAIANTVLMDFSKLTTLATNRLGDTQGTILDFLMKHNVYTTMTGQPLTIRYVRGLETAGASGGSRLIAYNRNPKTLKAHIPMPHRFLPAFVKSPLYTEVPGIFRLGGLDIRKPKEVRYMDGI